MEKKLYKVLYTIYDDEDIIYFSADNLTEVISALAPNKELHSIHYVGKTKILKG